MLIERKIKVDGGFAIDYALTLEPGNPPRLRFVTYDFQPINPADPDSPHVADITHEGCAGLLLAVAPETYARFKELPR